MSVIDTAGGLDSGDPGEYDLVLSVLGITEDKVDSIDLGHPRFSRIQAEERIQD